MFRKSIIMALAAAASLGALAISTTSASAFGHFGGAQRYSAVRVGTPHVAFRQNFALRRLGFAKLYPHYNHWNWWWLHHHHEHWGWWWWHHHRRWVWGTPVYSTPVYASAPSYSSAPAHNTCTCLTKTYTQEGAVVFKDVCTNEMAMNPPAADVAPQAPASLQQPMQQPQPMQQGYLQPQPQPMQ